ncbi:DMT family transporter [Cognatishimia sp. F0-27]|uniref:DMT family transporter n=1 Tax=Cognatishimia sp. F0-27 TaxID=2816855 RepID=UPI001D0C8644|nr:DMT family transporter [Cognatishimia sp. F0-27]MCC1494413.1 DMT family transporter [Cognatishimia sp. F0-27]
MTAARDPRNLAGGAWILADMALNIWALSIVKAMGLDYGPAQLVFLRACVGLALIAPWIWRDRRAFRGVDKPVLHLARVAASMLALSASFFALARMPFALFSAIGFTRPFVMMALAALLLHERIPARRWLAALVAFVGVLVAVNPAQMAAPSAALLAALATVVFGSLAVILTRALAGTPTVVMMAFYTGGLTLFSAPLAFLSWVPVTAADWVPLLAIGFFAQSAQLCFLRAHALAEAGFLAPLGYLSLVMTTAVGWAVFAERPNAAFVIGATLILAAALWTTRTAGTARRS